MSTIIVPTDFSENAFVAAQYAASLAKETDSKVLLYHAYIVLYSGFEEKGVSVQHVEWADKEAATGMETLLSTMKEQYPGVQFDGQYERGFMIDTLSQKLKEQPEIDLIVMGTKGATNVAESIFGSTTYEVIKKAKIPVLVIPGDTPDFSMNRIGFFSDYNLHEIAVLEQVKKLLTPVSDVEVIHLLKAGEDAGQKSTSWKQSLDAAFGPGQIQVAELPVEKVELNEVVRIVKERSLDLLIFTRPDKPFFEKIFVKSLTKAVANYPVVPSLFVKE